jgi:hypothetical protein
LLAESSIAATELLHDPAEADAHLRRIYAVCLANLGVGHIVTARTARLLGSVSASAGRKEDAETYMVMSLADTYARGFEARPDTVWALATLGGVQESLGRFELSLSLFEEARELAGPRPPGDPALDLVLDKIVRLHRRLLDDEGALEAAHEWLDATPADHPQWIARQSLVEEIAASIRDRDL